MHPSFLCHMPRAAHRARARGQRKPGKEEDSPTNRIPQLPLFTSERQRLRHGPDHEFGVDGPSPTRPRPIGGCSASHLPFRCTIPSQCGAPRGRPPRPLNPLWPGDTDAGLPPPTSSSKGKGGGVGEWGQTETILSPWTACGQRRVGSKNSQTTPATTSTTPNTPTTGPR